MYYILCVCGKYVLRVALKEWRVTMRRYLLNVNMWLWLFAHVPVCVCVWKRVSSQCLHNLLLLESQAFWYAAECCIYVTSLLFPAQISLLPSAKKAEWEPLAPNSLNKLTSSKRWSSKSQLLKEGFCYSNCLVSWATPHIHSYSRLLIIGQWSVLGWIILSFVGIRTTGEKKKTLVKQLIMSLPFVLREVNHIGDNKQWIPETMDTLDTLNCTGARDGDLSLFICNSLSFPLY